MSTRPYQICTRCVMDTSDPLIEFDEAGVCNHCREFDATVAAQWHRGPDGWRQMEEIAATIKTEGTGKEYDCVIGLSGGVDSSYLAYVVVRKLGLRPLAVHVDAGWNSDEAVRNIESIVEKLGIDLFTNVIDWEEMQDLQVAYLKSGVENQDTPQDHAFFASLYNFAVKNGIRWVLSGYNISSESVLPRAWGYNPRDSRQLRAIHRLFGKRKLRTYPIATLFNHYVYWPHIRRMRIVYPLNYMDYNKETAKAFLESELGWRNYGGKHHESRFTKFFQAHWLPTKFGYDKRRAHLSSLILAGQTTRDKALKELTTSPYPADELAQDIDFIRKKLGLNEAEFSAILDAPPHTYRDYPSWAWLRDLLHALRRYREMIPRPPAKSISQSAKQN